MKALIFIVYHLKEFVFPEGGGNRRLKAPIKFLGISVGKFEDHTEIKKTKKILDYFCAGTSKNMADNSNDSVKQEKANNEQLDMGNKTTTKSDDKDYIMKKFFKVVEKPQKTDFQSLTKQNLAQSNITNDAANIESSLDKQESFFAKILNQHKDPSVTKIQDSDLEKIRTTTPVCDAAIFGEDSNETCYSGSTIVDEINNSVALFEDDPQDVSRITSIRELLNSSKRGKEDSDTVLEPEKNIAVAHIIPQNEPLQVETFNCPECSISIPMNEVAEHSDYHLALKLRELERLQVRREIKQKHNIIKTKQHDETKNKQPEQHNSSRNETISSIANFLVKIDDNVPTETCSECNKKVPLENFGEHLDFHEAQKLNRELNKKTNPSFTGNNVKRKRKSNSPIKKNKMPCRSIDSFFR